MLRRALLVLSIIPAFVAGMVGIARAQIDGQTPSIVVRPLGTSENDPNAGQWFVTNLVPGETKRLQVQLSNPAAVEQTVTLYLADMRFTRDGVPQVTNVPIDVGTWGRFDRSTVRIAAQQTLVEAFTITAPEGADPGDHVGAVVVEHKPEGSGNIRSIKRVAVRLYATLPGDARRDFEIDGVDAQKDSGFMARELIVNVRLRNTGRVRLEPTVQVDGATAEGPDLLMSRSTETYIAVKPAPFWGGPVRLRIDAQTRSLGLVGPVRQLRVTIWVIPWHLLAMLLAAAGVVVGSRWALRKRGSRYRALQEDLRRIERLVTMSAGRGNAAPLHAEPPSPKATIRAASKLARRTGDLKTAARLEDTLTKRRSTHL